MIPHINQVIAQAWQYMMFESETEGGHKFMQYGETVQPISMSDFFLGITFLPIGTTTNADRTVKLTVTGDLMNQVVPMLMQIPGLSADPIKAVRSILRERLDALGVSSIEEILGLVPPTEADVAKQGEYMKLLAEIGFGRVSPQNATGGDGGIGLGMQGGQGEAIPEAKDRSGGAATGVQENKQI
jgi:hypothetical protein